MTEPLGRRRWAIAEGYIPGRSTGPKPELENHETCCILNTGDRDALVRLMVEKKSPVARRGRRR